METMGYAIAESCEAYDAGMHTQRDSAHQIFENRCLHQWINAASRLAHFVQSQRPH